ncbi:MAG: hypothetical protein V4530_02955 [Pseudomonadota bacterium]
MSDTAITFTILPLSALVALLATAAIAYFLGRRLKDRVPAILIAGLALPVTIMIAAYYGVTTDDPEGPPPGMVLMGALSVAAIAAPITLIVSGLAVRYARR